MGRNARKKLKKNSVIKFDKIGIRVNLCELGVGGYSVE
jgi:hypothetical protein